MGMSYELTQGSSTYDVEAIPTTGWTASEFYSYSDPDGASANTPWDLEQENTSQLFLFDGRDGLSLFFIHDRPHTSSGGQFELSFSGLPSAGNWIVQDDSGDSSYGRQAVSWGWAPCCTDGGVFQGGLTESFEITIEPQAVAGIDRWIFRSGTATNVIDLDLTEQITLSNNRVSVTATTLSTIPGGSEDSQDPDGDDLNSAMPDYFGKALDAWFIGEKREDLPDDLDDALAARRTMPEYPGEEFRQYRTRNEVSISFRTEDGQTIADWASVSVDQQDLSDGGSEVAVEGEIAHGEDNAIRNILADPSMNWFDGDDSKEAKRTNFGEGAILESRNKVTVDGVEGVRASVIHGGKDTFIVDMKRKLLEEGPIEFLRRLSDAGASFATIPSWIIHPPTIYTFLESILMADGTSLSVVWDASRYPKHYLYVDGDKKDDNNFEKGPALTGWKELEDLNVRFTQWVFEEQDSRSPFSPHYRNWYESEWNGLFSYGPHPVMSWSQSGDILTAQRLESAIDIHFPWD